MNDRDHELLSQYLDGELGASRVVELERRLAAEPALAAHLAQLQRVNTTLQSAFNYPGADTVPPQVTHMLETPAGNVVAFPQRRAANWGLAVAASLLAATGLLFFDTSQPGDQISVDTLLVEALETTPSRAEGWELLADGRQMRPILSFHSDSEGWCREYLMADQDAYWRGVACRSDSTWVTAVRAAEAPSALDSGAEYRPAGAGDSQEVQNFVELHATGIALDASEEAKLIANGWK